MVDEDSAARGGRSLVDGMVSGSLVKNIGEMEYWIWIGMDLGFGFGSFPSHHHHHRETMFDGQTRAASESVANVRRTDSVLQPPSQAMVTTDGEDAGNSSFRHLS